MPRTTLIRSPAVDPSKSPIENVLELTELYEFGPVRRPLLQLVYPTYIRAAGYIHQHTVSI